MTLAHFKSRGLEITVLEGNLGEFGLMTMYFRNVEEESDFFETYIITVITYSFIEASIDIRLEIWSQCLSYAKFPHDLILILYLLLY